MKAPSSLFSNLLAWSLATLGLLWLSFIIAGYLIGLEETDELMDGQLASVAALVVDSGAWPQTTAQPSPMSGAVPAGRHEYQQPITLVVWDADGRVVLHRGPAPLPGFDRSDGFASLQLGQPPQAWRSFARWSAAEPRRRVMVLIGQADRDELALDIAGDMAMPGLLLLPALALGLGLALRRGLRPLRSLSDDVQALGLQPGQGLHNTHPAQEFSTMVAAVNTLVQRFNDALRRERELAGELAHELRTPLAALVLQARALRESPGTAASPDQTQALARLEHDALQAGAVLAELLALARASRTALADAAVPVDLVALAQRVLADRAQVALAGGHDLALVQSPPGAVATSAPFTVRGHAVLLGLALANLVDNALAHSSGATLVELRLDATSQCLQVCNGPLPGAPTKPSDPMPGPSNLGFGLGHRVVAKVAELHGALFSAVPAPAGFSHCYQLQFAMPAVVTTPAP